MNLKRKYKPNSMTKHTSIKTSDVNFFTCTCVEKASLAWISTFINEHSKQFVDQNLIPVKQQNVFIFYTKTRSKWSSCTSANTINNYSSQSIFCLVWLSNKYNLFYRWVSGRVWKIPRNSPRSLRFSLDNTTQGFFAISSTPPTLKAVGSSLFISNV